MPTAKQPAVRFLSGIASGSTIGVVCCALPFNPLYDDDAADFILERGILDRLPTPSEFYNRLAMLQLRWPYLYGDALRLIQDDPDPAIVAKDLIIPYSPRFFTVPTIGRASENRTKEEGGRNRFDQVPGKPLDCIDDDSIFRSWLLHPDWRGRSDVCEGVHAATLGYPTAVVMMFQKAYAPLWAAIKSRAIEVLKAGGEWPTVWDLEARETNLAQWTMSKRCQLLQDDWLSIWAEATGERFAYKVSNNWVAASSRNRPRDISNPSPNYSKFIYVTVHLSQHCITTYAKSVLSALDRNDKAAAKMNPLYLGLEKSDTAPGLDVLDRHLEQFLKVDTRYNEYEATPPKWWESFREKMWEGAMLIGRVAHGEHVSRHCI